MNYYINTKPITVMTDDGARIRFVEDVTYVGGFDFAAYETTGRPSAFLQVTVDGRHAKAVLSDTDLVNNFRFVRYAHNTDIYAPVQRARRPRIKKE